MKSGFRIEWTNHAKDELAHTLRYLEENFSEREVRRLVRNIESTLLMISQNPQTFPASSQRKNVRRAIVFRLNTLYYHVGKDKIEIVSFFSNRQDPKKDKFR